MKKSYENGYWSKITYWTCSAYYGTSSNARYWTWNKTLRHYLDLKENFVYDYDTKLLTRVKLNGVPY